MFSPSSKVCMVMTLLMIQQSSSSMYVWSSHTRYKAEYGYPVAPVAQRYHVTSDTLGREFDAGKRDFSPSKTKKKMPKTDGERLNR